MKKNKLDVFEELATSINVAKSLLGEGEWDIDIAIHVAKISCQYFMNTLEALNEKNRN